MLKIEINIFKNMFPTMSIYPKYQLQSFHSSVSGISEENGLVCGC